MRSSVLAAVVLAAASLGAACSEAKVVEDSAAACANRRDDDGDGLIDCDDPDCFATEACERNAATCSNDVDDDRDGFLDCTQDSCKLLPVCKDAVETACNVAAKDTGCPRGKGCYIADNRRFCALEGPSLAGGPCGDTDPSDRSQGCAAGYLCVTGKRCARVCLRDDDCTRNSICRPLGADRALSVCTLSCNPKRFDCPSGQECVALQRTGLLLEDGGWAHQCVLQWDAPPAGTATVGQACVEDPRGRPASETCAPGLLCVPEPGGARCRDVCRASPDGLASACAGGFCYAIVPFSPQASRFDEPDVIGVCLP